MTQEDAFSYAAPGDPLLKRIVIRLVERMTGQPRLKRLYREYQEAQKSRGPTDFWQEAVTRLKLTLVYDRRPLESWPRSGPLLVVCNHPFGVVDGLSICALVAGVRPDFRILINAVLTRAEEVRHHLLPVDFSGNEAATKTNLRSRAAARDHLAQGGCLIVFPAGGVSTTPSLWHRRAVDAAWGSFTARLVVQAKAAVAPVYFEGQNSRLFQIASHIHLTLRLSLLFKEAHDRIGSKVVMRPGAAIAYSGLAQFGGGRALMDHLRKVTYDLA
ncbi:MAG TPA: lysophospholipid acyltransferase family protein [Rhizomicrobium sp.]|nr:lysophospholipid acyltransferase family protein [Rhizomicrobium sp.]